MPRHPSLRQSAGTALLRLWARAGKCNVGRGQPSRNSESMPHIVFSLKLQPNQVSASQGTGWRLRRLAGNLCPPKALREMRLWFQSWSYAGSWYEGTWSHRLPETTGGELKGRRQSLSQVVLKMPLGAVVGWTSLSRFRGAWMMAMPRRPAETRSLVVECEREAGFEVDLNQGQWESCAAETNGQSSLSLFLFCSSSIFWHTS